jgi:3-hydroxyisobutyrate dehydrogenase
MGGRIASHIVAAGFPLVVNDRRPDAAAALAAAGAKVAETVLEVAASSEIVALCVIDDQQVQDVIAEIRPALGPGTTVLIHSSVAPATVRAAEEIVGSAGATLVDAPVSGSRPAADKGELTILLGGTDAAVALVEPVLRTYATTLLRCGDVGAGQAMKITNNVVLHMNHLILLEALRFGRTQGLAETAVLEAVNASSGRSWVTETWGVIDAMLDDHPQAGTPLLHAMMSKEMWQAVRISRETLTEMPLTALGVQVSPGFLRERESDLADGRAGV